MSGYFFVFDGMDGSGKSTALQTVAEGLRTVGHEVITTREPGGSPLAESIRRVMLDDWGKPVPVESELLLVFAARAAHMQQTILPALQRGAVVLCDRFVDSSYVYQGLLGKADVAWIDDLTQRTVSRPPNQIYIFDLPVEIALGRMQQRAHSDRFDRQAEAALTPLRQAYLERAKQQDRCLVNADQPALAVAQDVVRHIQSMMA